MVEIEVFTQEDVKDAQSFARRWSACSRRKYGIMLKDENRNLVGLSTNYRVGKYCNDKYCVRTARKAPHCEQVELGGEIHAEQAMLISFADKIDENSHVLLAATIESRNFYGLDNIPCHVCAMMLKFAGVRNVWFPYEDSTPKPTSIDEILEYYERSDD